MNDHSESPSAELLCPQCRGVLVRKGKVVDSGKYKKWVDEWCCPVHGVVATPQLPQNLPRKQGPAPAEPAA